ncbi:MAG TPA: SDR family NAD(P)-dependent oxidoreductase [Solirubrobacterales bacterium]|nr:SDR family NAD(P)-dependent oxidoreductase [Solirubrobacterales bacterium]
MELRGKTVLLTGATGGLGRAIAAVLAERGATMVLSSRREQELGELAGTLAGEGHHWVVADLANEGATEELAAAAGDVDVLVANAGIPAGGRLERLAPEEVERALRVNLTAPVRLTRDLLPGMRERGAGQLVFISSLQAKAALPRSSLYSATKFGLRGFALSLRQDLAGTGVGASVVLPGFVRDAGMFAESGSKAPLGLGTVSPRQVGEAVADAIERDRAEVHVAPVMLRLAVAIAHRRPHLAARVTGRRAGKVADKVIEGQADKR